MVEKVEKVEMVEMVEMVEHTSLPKPLRRVEEGRQAPILASGGDRSS